MDKAPSLRDRIIAALTLWGEARGETHQGRVAVMWVIRNRAEANMWWGRGIAGVCLYPYQFSCWNSNDPNRSKMLGMLIGRTLDAPRLTETAAADPLVMDCLEVVDAVCGGREIDPTHGASHYFDKRLPSTPTWAIGRVPSAVIGHHAFYANIERGYRPKAQSPSVSVLETPARDLPKPPLITTSSGPPDPPARTAVHSTSLNSEAPAPKAGASGFWGWFQRLLG